MRRKFLSVVLCVCMMLTMAPFAFAAGSDDTSTTNTQEQAPVANSSGSGSGSPTTSVTLPSGNSGNLTISTDNAVLDGSAEGTANLIYTNGKISVTGNNVTIKNLTFGDGASLEVNADTFTLTDCIFNGSTYIRNPVSLNVSNATVTGNTFSGTESDATPAYYNAIEFSLNSGHKLNSATLSNNIFTAAIENNYFSAYYFENNAKITVENNVIQSANKGSSAIRISNSAHATGVEFNLNKNTYEYGTTTDTPYEGFILLEDFAKTQESEQTQEFTTFKINITNLTAPNNAKQLLYVYDDQDGIISYNQPAVTGDSSIEKFAVAKVGDFYSPSLASAVAAATDGQTITLLKDTALTSSISIKKNITLDLGGKTLSRNGGMLLDIYGNVTIQNGTVAMTNTTGSGADIWVNKTATLTVEKSATISAPSNSFAIAYYEDCTAAKVTLKGTLTGDGSGITVNGNIKDKDSSNQNTSNTLILDGTTINVKGHGVYQAGYATTTFTENASTITGSTGIEVRAGNLTVTNSTITGNGTFNCKSNPSGTTTDGVGIAIAQHTTKLPIDVTISGGNISGTYAVYESDPENNGTEYTKDVKLSITGGYFTTDPTSYLAANRYTVASDKDGYSYMVTDQAPSAAPVIVADKTEAQANLPQNTDTNVATSINNVIKNANIDGVAEAVKKDAILAEANVPDADKGNKNVKIVIDVKVNVTATNVETTGENNAITTLTFEASPVASIKKVTSSRESYYSNTDTTPISVSNSYLNGQAITVKLPLSTGFTPKQIKHTSVDGTVEYFLDHLERGAKVFTIDKANNCAILKITKFSTFEVSGTQTYVEPSSGGSISTPTTYAVNVNAATNGAVAADKKTASKGTTVTVTASPSKGYVVDAVKVVDKDGKDVAVTEKDGKYVFTMPASAVTVTGSFKAETPAPAALPFTDVKSGNWFYDAVKYAYEQGLMTGTSATTFAPNGTMNRAMIVTVLYRLENSPAVTGASKFTDVPAGQWYSDAVAWAAANKIVNGYDETTFGPMNAVTREQMAAILFRYEQVKGLENVTLEENLNRFPDQNKISAYAIPALQWAVGQKIINGNADGTLDPTGTATRAQVAQIFTNLLNK